MDEELPSPAILQLMAHEFHTHGRSPQVGGLLRSLPVLPDPQADRDLSAWHACNGAERRALGVGCSSALA